MQPMSCCAGASRQGILRRGSKKEAGTDVFSRALTSRRRRPSSFSTGTTCAAWPKPWPEMEHQISGKGTRTFRPLAIGEIRIHGSDVVLQLEVEFVDQFIRSLAPQV